MHKIFTENEKQLFLKEAINESGKSDINIIDLRDKKIRYEITEIISGITDKANAKHLKYEPSFIQTKYENELTESKAPDNSYYLWFKNANHTTKTTAKSGYENIYLYQSIKVNESKSMFRLYILSFILLFSMVLVMLIFSPFLFKILYIPANHQYSESNYLLSASSGEKSMTQKNNKKNNSGFNTLTKDMYGIDAIDQKLYDVLLIPDILTYNDNKNQVIYILNNAKYTIQESSWDSEIKAINRLNSLEKAVNFNIRGKIIKSDIENKGTWYRVWFGEFAQLDDAKTEAREIRNIKNEKITTTSDNKSLATIDLAGMNYKQIQF